MTRPRVRPFEQIINKQREEARNQENSARLAHSFGTFVTSGWGEFIPEDKVEFEAPYLYRPSVTVGSSLDGEDDAENVRLTRLPRCGGTVIKWDQTARGLYTGAWVAIWVEDRSPFIEPSDPDPNPDYTIVHDFVFLGIAIKDLPSPLNGRNNGAF